jgi:epoxyqueuosine reductase QueG
MLMQKPHNLERLKAFFEGRLAEMDRHGVVGVAQFRKVYDELMPAQRSKLEGICSGQVQRLLRDGSIVCVGLAYQEYVVDCIDVSLSDGTADKDAWNVYAREYHKLNRLLNAVSKEIADHFDGVAVPPTVEGITVENVEDYYRMTVSHRVVAENAGLGWRGKNELVINERFSCAVRFASVITSVPLPHAEKVESSCRECQACIESCSFLRNKDKLENYRESCRKYIVKLGLEGEVCGKCIKACYRHSIFSNNFSLK